MAERLSQLVPFNQLESRILEFRGVLPPPVKEERLGVNVEMIEELCQLSWIKRLYVIGDDNGQVSVVQPYIVGVTPGGNPRISGSVPELVATFKPSLMPVEDRKDKLAEAKIEINSREVIQRLLRYNRVKYSEGIRSPSAWAFALDLILKQ